jgi:hypothetical protein
MYCKDCWKASWNEWYYAWDTKDLCDCSRNTNKTFDLLNKSV